MQITVEGADGKPIVPKANENRELVVSGQLSVMDLPSLQAAVEQSSQVAVTSISFDVVGSDLNVRLKDAAGDPIADTTIGSVAVDLAGNVSLPLDVVALAGRPATWILVGASAATTIDVATEQSLKSEFPRQEIKVSNGEFRALRVTNIYELGLDVTSIELHFGVS